MKHPENWNHTNLVEATLYEWLHGHMVGSRALCRPANVFAQYRRQINRNQRRSERLPLDASSFVRGESIDHSHNSFARGSNRHKMIVNDVPHRAHYPAVVNCGKAHRGASFRQLPDGLPFYTAVRRPIDYIWPIATHE
jgi:hypothetical protein